MSEPGVYAQGRLRGDKVQFPEGIGYCVWYPIVDENGSETSGLCWDFSELDIDDLMALLQVLKDAPAEPYE